MKASIFGRDAHLYIVDTVDASGVGGGCVQIHAAAARSLDHVNSAVLQVVTVGRQQRTIVVCEGRGGTKYILLLLC